MAFLDQTDPILFFSSPRRVNYDSLTVSGLELRAPTFARFATSLERKWTRISSKSIMSEDSPTNTKTGRRSSTNSATETVMMTSRTGLTLTSARRLTLALAANKP